MKINRIRLSQFRCFDDETIRFGDGVIAIHGLNGSGKSSMLEGIFFTLYGSKALPSELTLDDIIMNGAENSTVEMWFSHQGEEYHIERRIRRTESNTTNNKSVLSDSSGKTLADGAKDVRNKVYKMLRMDADSFVNCAYVRQQEVTKLINASPSERQDLIDELLQLGELERFRERASKTRIGVGRVEDTQEGAVDQLKDQIEEKEEENLQQKLASITDEIDTIDKELDELKEKEEHLKSKGDEAQQIIDNAEEQQQEIEQLDDKINELKTKISDAKEERINIKQEIDESQKTQEQLTPKMNESVQDSPLSATSVTELQQEGNTVDIDPVEKEIKTTKNNIDSKRSEVQTEKLKVNDLEGEIRSLQNEINTLDERIEDKQDRVNSLQQQIQKKEKSIDQYNKQIKHAKESIKEIKEEFTPHPIQFGDAETYYSETQDQINELNEEKQDVVTTLNTAKKHVEKAEELIDEGKCPECGQDLGDSPHVNDIDEEKERVQENQTKLDELNKQICSLEEQLQTADELIEYENEVTSLKEDIEMLDSDISTTIEEKESLLDSLDSVNDSISSLEEQMETNEDKSSQKRSKIQEVNEEMSTLEQELDELENNIQLLQQIEKGVRKLNEAINTVNRKQNRLQEINSMIDEWNDALDDANDNKQSLKDEYDPQRIKHAKKNRDEVYQKLRTVRDSIDDLDGKKGDLQGERGAINNSIQELEKLKKQLDKTEDDLERLNSLYGEMESLQGMYASLRKELREKNVSHLQRILNDIFSMLYQNDAYSRIELSNSYELTVYEKGGEKLRPQQLSGGEKVLFNLSLRCAIYKLLAEGIEGSSTMPPLILDEPTAQLDTQHVDKIAGVVELMRDLGIPQVFVVSHNDTVVDSSDEQIEVTQNPVTNRSSITNSTDALEQDWMV